MDAADRPAVEIRLAFELEAERERHAAIRARAERLSLAWLVAAPHLKDGIREILHREGRAVDSAIDPPESAAESLARARAAGLLPPGG